MRWRAYTPSKPCEPCTSLQSRCLRSTSHKRQNTRAQAWAGRDLPVSASNHGIVGKHGSGLRPKKHCCMWRNANRPMQTKRSVIPHDTSSATHLQVPPGAWLLPAVRAVPLRQLRCTQVLSRVEHSAWSGADLSTQCIPVPQQRLRCNLRTLRTGWINQRQQAQRSCSACLLYLGSVACRSHREHCTDICPSLQRIFSR